MQQTCKFQGCDNTFEPVAVGTVREKKFCCSTHRQMHHTNNTVLDTQKHWEKQPEVKRLCARDDCGNEFIINPRYPDKVFCSRRCKDIQQNIERRVRPTDEQMPAIEEEPGTPIDVADTDEMIAEMHKRGFYVMQADPSEQDQRFKIDLEMFEGDKLKFAVASDSHMCSRQQQLTLLHNFYHYAHEKEGITEFFNPGDVFNGDGKQHKGQEYENFIHGEDEQLAYAVEHFPKIPGCRTRVIGGSHDYSFFKSSGSDIVKRLAEKRDDIEYYGYAGAYFTLAENVDMYLYHPAGGTAYALSYQPQKKIENFAPENKPRICIFGHYHRWLQMQHRNVECVLAPCFQAQTPFLKAQGINPVLGGVIVEVWMNEDGIARFRAELIRYYVPLENDY